MPDGNTTPLDHVSAFLDALAARGTAVTLNFEQLQVDFAPAPTPGAAPGREKPPIHLRLNGGVTIEARSGATRT